MKNLFFGILLFTMLPSYAQDRAFYIGPKIGGSVSWITNDPLFGYENQVRPGGLIGGFIDLNFSEMLGLSAELLYITKGARYENNIFGTEKINLDYIEIPVMIKGRLGDNKIAPYLSTGLAPAFISRKKSRSNNQSKQELTNVESFDLGYLINLGLQFKGDNRIITIEARYNKGLLDVFTNRTGTNSLLSINFGYGF